MSDRFGKGGDGRGQQGADGTSRPPGQNRPSSQGGPYSGHPGSYQPPGQARPPQGPPQPPQGPPTQWTGYGAPPPGPRRRTTLWIGAGIVALLAVGTGVFFALRASGADIETDDGAVANAEPFLDGVRSDWRSQLPNENVNIGDDPSCYYVVDDDSEKVTGVIACGGIRRLNTDDGEVWDTYSYDVTQNAEGEQVASSPEPSDTAVERPGGNLLAATGDEAPDDADDLSAPDLPSADEGILRSGEDQVDVSTLELEGVERPEDAGEIITPGGTVTVQSVATTPYLPGEPAERAADGEVFRVVTYTIDANDDADGNIAATLLVDAAGQQRKVDEGDPYGFGEDEQTSFVVSVPEGEQASLVVASAGHEQRVDLETGERQDDPVTDAYYRKVTQQDIGKTKNYPVQRVQTPDGKEPAAYTLGIDSAQISPYTGIGGLGYADKGKVWLRVSFTAEFRNSTFALSDERTDFNWTVDVGGKTIESAKVSKEEYGDEGTVVYEVPSGITAAAIKAEPSVVVTSNWDAKRRTVSFGVTKSKVTFPK